MLSDRLAVMHQGKVLQVGTPQEIYDQPVSSTVAKFIGLSNVLSGTVTRFEGGLCWVEHEGLPPVVVKCPTQGPPPGSVTVMIRPERLHISSEISAKGYDNTLPAIVNQTVFNGNEVLYHARLRNEAIWMARVSITEAQVCPFTVGQPVYLQWSAHEGLALPTPLAPS